MSADDAAVNDLIERLEWVEKEYCRVGFSVTGQSAGDAVALIQSLRAEVERLRGAEAAQWQPIETAPKDGTRILVRQASDAAVAAWMMAIEDGSGAWIIWRRVGPEAMAIHMPVPTAWMPLPLTGYDA